MDRSSMQQAIAHHQAGRLAPAEAIYRRLIVKEPRNADALNLLAVLLRQLGRHAEAVELARRAIELKRSVPDYHFNLAEALRAVGQWDEAIARYRKTLDLAPSDAEAYHGLGAALLGKGDLAASIEALRRAMGLAPKLTAAVEDLAKALVRLGKASEAESECRKRLASEPNHAGLHFALASALAHQQRLAEAIDEYRRAIALRPAWPEACVNHSGLLARVGRFGEAAAAAEQAIRINPGLAEAHLNLGAAVEKLGQHEKAIACYRKAIELQPSYAEAHNNLGLLLSRLGLLADAEASLRRAIELKDGYAEAWSNLGNTLKDGGRIPKAIEAYRKALELQPDFSPAQSNLLFALNYTTDHSPEELFREHQAWGTRYAATLAIAPATLGSKSETRLRMGYVSPDLREHSVSFFLEPILANHDRDRFEIFCYSDVTREDAVTGRLRGSVHAWRDCAGLSDDQLARRINEDRIDVLIDLAGHTGHNRLRMFTQRPAPVQISYLGYPNTTGLSQMGWRITDDICDPPGMTEPWHTEKLLRIPAPFLCYRPPVDAPPVAPLPASSAEAAGRITFGCFNQLAKVSDAIIEVWAAILKQLPSSRLVLKSKSLRDEPTRMRTRGRFAAHGIGDGQLVLLGPEPKVHQHLSRYGHIDIALDTFPYHGTTTTCEALWMGVPVVSWAGDVHVSRVGASLLASAGLQDWVASSSQQYLRLAVAMGKDLVRLADLRSSLRENLKRSPLMDAPGFTRRLENILASAISL